jgi:EAL domain-containing protein (putative c-di-GMP-specific phosphodiesterase class I)
MAGRTKVPTCDHARGHAMMPTPEDPQPTPETLAHRLRVVDLHDPVGLLAEVAAGPDAITTHFCAVADLGRGAAAGYEVLLGVGDREPAAPRALSQQVHQRSAGRLEAVLVRRALAEAPGLPDNTFLMINVSAPALAGPELPAVLEGAGGLDRIVLVVTDEAEGDDADAVVRALERVREAGGLIAVDETGSGYASLRQILTVRPDYVRIGSEFVAEVDRDQAKAAVVETIAGLAARIDATVIAGGVPGRAELVSLRRMGIPLGQGLFVGSPMEDMTPLSDTVCDVIRQAAPPSEGEQTVAGLVEARPALPWADSIEDIADAFLEDPRYDVVVLVDEQNRPLALAERAALLRGEPFERPVMRITPNGPLKAVARRAAARPLLERFHPLVACDRRGVYLGIVRVEQLLDALAQD